MGWSAGLTLRSVGGEGRFWGRSREALEIMVCTSCAAASRLRLKLNCKVMLVLPRELTEVMESRPAMVENCRSRGMATVAAMVLGLAPGWETLTTMVGKSTLGRSLTGSI